MTQTYILEIVTQSTAYRTDPKYATTAGNAHFEARKVLKDGALVHTKMTVDGRFVEVQTDSVFAKYVGPAAIHTVNIVEADTHEV